MTLHATLVIGERELARHTVWCGVTCGGPPLSRLIPGMLGPTVRVMWVSVDTP